ELRCAQEGRGPSASPRLRANLSPPRLRARGEAGALFEGEGGVQDRLLVQGLADELEAEGEAFGVEAGGDRHRRQAGEAGGDGEDVVQVHGDRVVRLFA